MELSFDKLCAYVAVDTLKSYNEICDSATEEERAKLRDFAVKINLESINTRQLVAIKPCPPFPVERLHSVLVKTVEKSLGDS